MMEPATLATIVTAVIFVFGFFASLLPVFPGTVIVFVGIFVHKIWVPHQSVSWGFVGLAAGVVLLTMFFDYLFSVWGARRFGAGKAGAIGALVGGVVGIFIPPQPLWLIFGPGAGAILGEFFAGRTLHAAGRAGIGTFIGGLVAFGFKLGVSCLLIAGFFIAIS
jgi:uncharacterized protein